MRGRGYPIARPRLAGAHATVADKFDRHEASNGFVTVGDTDADILVFSGTPDRVEVFVELNDVIVTFGDYLGLEEAEITLRAGVRYEPDLPARRVIARNAVAGAVGRVQVVGKWAEAG